MKEYKKPKSEIILPSTLDILTDSGTDGTDLPYINEDDIVG